MTWNRWKGREAKIKAAEMMNDCGWLESSRSERLEYVPAPPDMSGLVGLWEEAAYHQHISHQGKSLGCGKAILTLNGKDLSEMTAGLLLSCLLKLLNCYQTCGAALANFRNFKSFLVEFPTQCHLGSSRVLHLTPSAIKSLLEIQPESKVVLNLAEPWKPTSAGRIWEVTSN